jgi:hypothetical protein
MTVPTVDEILELTVEDWQINTFGSLTAFQVHWDSCDLYQKADLERQWERAICENAGIPCHTWIGNALDCARKRLEADEAERSTVSVFNSYINNYIHSDKTAYRYWQIKSIIPSHAVSGPYGTDPSPNWYQKK